MSGGHSSGAPSNHINTRVWKMFMPSKTIDHPFRRFEHAGWERASRVYADTFEAATRLFAPALLEAAGIRKDMELLEVACGTGFVAALAASRGAVVTGIDFSAGMVAEAARRHPSLSFREADAEDLPFPDSAFDGVVINFGVHHFPFPQRALSEAYRVLRAGGRLAFTIWAPPDQNALHGTIVDAIREVGDVGAPSFPAPSEAVTDIAACQRLLREAGFDGSALRAGNIEAFLSVDSAQKLIEMFIEGAVRMSAVIRSQPPEKIPMILVAVERALARYRQDGRFRIPATAILAAGIK